jgi:hypothetical protein
MAERGDILMLVRNNQQRSPPMNARKVKMHQAEILRKGGHKQKEIAEILGASVRMEHHFIASVLLSPERDGSYLFPQISFDSVDLICVRRNSSISFPSFIE